MSAALAELPAAAVITYVRLRDELRAILGDDLAALWGYGARARSDAPRRLGDVDVVALVRRRPDARGTRSILAARRRIERDAGVPIDLSCVLTRDARRAAIPSDAIRAGRRYETWALHRAQWLAGGYVLLHGSPPEALVPAARWREIAEALRLELEHLERHVAGGDDDLYETSYALLNGSRILYTLAKRDPFVSKRAAGGWALRALPTRWHAGIRAAIRAYDGESTVRDRRALRAATAPFVAFVRERSARGLSSGRVAGAKVA